MSASTYDDDLYFIHSTEDSSHHDRNGINIAISTFSSRTPLVAVSMLIQQLDKFIMLPRYTPEVNELGCFTAAPFSRINYTAYDISSFHLRPHLNRQPPGGVVLMG